METAPLPNTLRVPRLAEQPSAPAAREYRFGDEMATFVATRVTTLADRFMRVDFPGRVLHAFLITLDRARESANAGQTALVRTAPLVDSAQVLLDLLETAERRAPPDTLTTADIARVVALSAQLQQASSDLALAWDASTTSRSAVARLRAPLTQDEFRRARLHLVPLNFVYSSIEETAPMPPFAGRDFETPMIPVWSETSSDSEPNGEQGLAMASMFLSVWQESRDQKRYEKQAKKYAEALAEVPRRMPADTAVYQAFVTAFDTTKEEFHAEMEALEPHLDSLSSALRLQQETITDARYALENRLLADRVRFALERLRPTDFRHQPAATALLRETSFDVRAAARRVEWLHDNVRRGEPLLRTFSHLEDIEETTAAVDSVLARLDSVPLFRSQRSELTGDRRWFARYHTWASRSLRQGAPTELPLSGTSVQALGAWAWSQPPTAPAAPAAAKMDLAAPGQAAVATQWQEGVAFSVYLSTGGAEGGPSGTPGAGRPYHRGFGAGEIWSRDVDGGFPQDRRSPGGIYPERVRMDLEARTSRAAARHAEAVLQVRAATARRRAEVPEQSARVAEAARGATQLRPRLPRSPLPTPTAVRPQLPRLGERHRRIEDVGYDIRLSVERARQDRLMALEGISVNSERAREYRRLHGEYLKAAEAFWRAGHEEEAESLFDAGLSIRAWLRGYTTAPERLATFNPRYPIQMLVETLGQKFPLEERVDDAELYRYQLCTPEFVVIPDRMAACNRRSAEVLELIYGYTGFLDPDARVLASLGLSEPLDRLEDGRRVLRAREMLVYATLRTDEWQRLGTGLDAEALSRAQRLANVGVPVIAVTADHVAVVMPGELRKTGWTHPVPNIYNSVLNRPGASSSYYYGPVSGAWSATRQGEVVFFALWEMP